MISKSGLYKHRVIPGHMGGTYEPSNVVLLTVKQHAAAHRKLYKKYGKREDWIAWKGLSGQINKKELSADVEILRRQHISEGLKGRQVSASTRLKISSGNLGKPKSLAHRASLSAARMGRTAWNKGKSFSLESREKMRQAKLGKVRGPYGKRANKTKDTSGS